MTVHAEAIDRSSLVRIQEKVKQYKAKLGVAFKPSTDLGRVDLSDIDVSLITVMTVNPGFSGQKFMPEVIPKVKRARQLFAEHSGVEIEVDGGVDRANAKLLSEEGASVLVAGNSVFGQPDPEKALRDLKDLVKDARI